MKLLPKLLFGTGLIVVLAIAAVVISLVYIDPNDYKGFITNKLKEETGRNIRIDGDIKLTYYPWLGLDVTGISVANAKGFGDKPFLHAKTVRARAQLLPLLRKQLKMDSLVLHGVTINLARDDKGASNWDDLVNPRDSTKKTRQASPLTALALGGIDIKDANVYWHDKQRGLEYNATHVNISTGALKFGEPIELVATLNVGASKPALLVAIKFNGAVVYQDKGDVLLLKPMLLTANVRGKQIPGDQSLVKLSSQIHINLNKETAKINLLDLSAFDTQIKAQIDAAKILSGKPQIVGQMDIKGKNLVRLLKIAEIEPLASELAAMSNKTFHIGASFNADTNRKDVAISQLDIALLDNKIDAEIYTRNLGSKTASAKGKIKANGADLPALIKIASQFIAGDQNIRSLASALTSVPKLFDLKTDFDVDLKSGLITIPALSINALGMTASGNINGKKINSDTPTFSGVLKAKGTNLPLLMQVGASLHGDHSELIQALYGIKQKAFAIDTQFDADIKSGKIDLPQLNVNAFGFKVSGNLKGDNIHKSNGNMKGKILINSQQPKALLSALGYADVAQVLQSININTGINGNQSNLSLKPFSLAGVFSGKQIPHSPATLTLQAEPNINLDKETVNLSELQIKGLGLDVKGSIKATKFKTAPTISGQLALAPFDLRQLMQALNKKAPKTADKNVLKHVALVSSFSGTSTSFSLKGLKAKLDETQLQGDINIKKISPLDLEFDLGLDKLNADRYLPPKTKTKAVTPEAAAVGAATGLPLEKLRAIKIKGDFKLGQLIVSNAKLSDMALGIRANKGAIKLAPAKAKLYQGSYVGKIQLDATGKLPKLTMNTKLSSVEIAPLLTDIIGTASVQGSANITLALSSSGADINLLRNNLSGTGNILIEKGVLYGIDIRKVLHDVEIMIESKTFGEPSLGEKSEFDKLTASLDIHSGIIDNHDLLLLGSGYNVSGKGMLLNLRDETWKYTLVAKVDATRVKRGEKTFNLGGYEIPITCRGKISEKNCDPDYGKIATVVLKKAVVDTLFQGIGVKKKDDASVPAESGEQQELSPQESPRDIKDKVIKNVLDKIF